MNGSGLLRATLITVICIATSTTSTAGEDAAYDAFLPGAEPDKFGYDIQQFDAWFPYEYDVESGRFKREGELWESGFMLEGQIGASLFKYASLGIGFGLGALNMDEELMLARTAPLVPVEQADRHTLSIRGDTVLFDIGPSLWIEMFPASFMAISIEGGIRYAFFPITPDVEGEKEETFGGDEIEIPGADDELEIDQVEYIRTYDEDIEINSAVYGRVGFHIELGRPGEMTGFFGVGKLLDIAPPEATFRGISLGDYGMQGLTARVGFRSVW